METLIWTGLFSPLVGFLILLLSSFFIKRKFANLVGCTSVLISFFCFAAILYIYQNGSSEGKTFTLFSWLPIDNINANFSVYIDSLAIMMALTVTGVGYLIHVYSIGYMEHDEDIARFFACMNLFVFMMLLLVLSSNLLLMYVGWEGVGLVSYLLIGYYYSRPTAAFAADKAFIVNRIGDLGLVIALLLTLYLFGTSEIQTVLTTATAQFPIGSPIIVILTLLLFLGACGKSAQLPLQVWLPDAMEGPTPVSALIHAATMVTAGVYLVVRLHALFLLSPVTLFIIGLIGVLTALYAAIVACGQTDLKKVLAYSTISQLGYMFLACSVGAFYAAMFHLMTHAFMKALLFLSAGNVVHMMSGITDMNKMGGLYKKFPITHVLFLIGVLAMAGLPPLSAFYSKDLILEQTGAAGFKIFFLIGIITALLTAFYLMRAYILTFWGKQKLNDKIICSIKEAPRVMLIPVSILSVLSMVGGYMVQYVSFTDLQAFLAKSDVLLSNPEAGLFNIETLMSTLAAFFGIAFSYLIYTRYQFRIGKTNPTLTHAFYINEMYDKTIVTPVRRFAEILSYVVEPDLFRGSIDKVKSITDKISHTLQKIQSGQIRSYIAWMALGTAILIALFIS